MRELAVRLGLRRCPVVWLIPGPLPPMVWAAFGPARLLFPAALLGRLDAEGRAALLLHELAHLRRCDHWVRWPELLAVGLYWWCPLSWWARWQLHLHEEECCDAWVVGELPPCADAGAILETIDFLAEARPAVPVAASGLGRLPSLKKRLTAIMQRRTPKRLSAAGWLAVLVCAALLPLRPAPAARGAGRWPAVPQAGQRPAPRPTPTECFSSTQSRPCFRTGSWRWKACLCRPLADCWPTFNVTWIALKIVPSSSACVTPLTARPSPSPRKTERCRCARWPRVACCASLSATRTPSPVSATHRMAKRWRRAVPTAVCVCGMPRPAR